MSSKYSLLATRASDEVVLDSGVERDELTPEEPDRNVGSHVRVAAMAGPASAPLEPGLALAFHEPLPDFEDRDARLIGALLVPTTQRVPHGLGSSRRRPETDAELAVGETTPEPAGALDLRPVWRPVPETNIAGNAGGGDVIVPQVY